MVRRRIALAALSLLVTATVAASQPAQPPMRPGGPGRAGGQMPPRGGIQTEAPRGTAIIRGAVLTADNGSPVRRAQVRVSGQGVGSRMATTDSQGRFEVRDLAAGRYTITASKGGFVTLQYGQRRPSEPGTPLEIADAQLVDKLMIALPRGSVIGGRITDEFGEPVANAVVSAMRFGYQAGARRPLPAGTPNARDTTDDQGQFRLFGLTPGEYLVSATLRPDGPNASEPSGDTTGYAPTYFPGTPTITEAQRVTVGVGQEQNGIAFSLIATKLVRVSGAVLSSQGSPVSAGAVTLTPANARFVMGALLQRFTGGIEQAGQFRIANVPPGRYLAQVRTQNRGPGNRGGGGGGATEFGRLDLTVGSEDVDGVVIVTAPGGRITGQIVSDAGALSQLRPQQVSLNAMPVNFEDPAPPTQTRINNDWTFEITGVFDARLFRVNVPRDWNLKAIELNGQDVTDTPVDVPPGQALSGIRIVLTDKSTEVNGRVVDGRGQAVTDATVVLFPADDTRWVYQSRFIRTARPDQQGSFSVRGLPPLDKYLAIALPGVEEGQANDPEFLARIREAATAFSLGNDSDVRTLELRWAAR